MSDPLNNPLSLPETGWFYKTMRVVFLIVTLGTVAAVCVYGWLAIWWTFPYGLIGLPWIGGTTAILIGCVKDRIWKYP